MLFGFGPFPCGAVAVGYTTARVGHQRQCGGSGVGLLGQHRRARLGGGLDRGRWWQRGRNRRGRNRLRRRCRCGIEWRIELRGRHFRGDRGRCLGSALSDGAAQSLAGCESGPGSRIDFTHYVEQLLGFFLRVEIPHVQSKALARFFTSARYKKRKALQPRVIRRRERDRRRGRTQVDDEGVQRRGARRRGAVSIASRLLRLNCLLHASFPDARYPERLRHPETCNAADTEPDVA